LHDRPLTPILFPYTTLFRSAVDERRHAVVRVQVEQVLGEVALLDVDDVDVDALLGQHEASAMTPRVGRPREERHDRSTVGDYRQDRKSTRLNSSHVKISYAV